VSLDVQPPAGASSEISLRNLTKDFGAVRAVDDVSLQIGAGEFFSLLGPSGCGKTTTLRMLGGFDLPTSGTIALRGRDVTRDPPDKRPVNMVFQSYALFPHLDVAGNIGFGLKRRGLAGDEISRRTGAILERVQLSGYERRRPHELSGGQQQRVALARALIMRPKVLLLDEPLAALDLKLRHAMQEELRRIHAEIGGTFIFVTHDQTEAFALASRIVVMNEGRIEQVGAPQDIYLDPHSLFVADFVGETNVLSGTRQNGSVRLAAGPGFDAPGAEGAVRAIIRPEAVRRGAGEITVHGQITDVVFLGNALKIVARLPSGETLSARDPDVRRYGTYVRDATESFGWSLSDQRILDGAQ
jgi:spermidine/putrescine transport system ATP-binding protein